MSIERPELHHRPDLLLSGTSDAEIIRDRRAGVVTSVRRGWYAATAELAELTAVQHHLLLMDACRSGPDLPFSHISAVVARELAVYGADLSRVHLTRTGRTGGGRFRDRHVHSAVLDPSQVEAVGDRWMTTLGRSLVDLARSSSTATAVVATDHALREARVTPEELAAALESCARAPGIARARRVLRQADGRSESPGESRTRLALDGLPLDAQVEIRDGEGRFVARTDLGCQEAMLLLEFDGRVKYTTLLAPGESITDVVLREKRREDRLRELGYIVVRITWDDLAHPERLRARIKQHLRRGLERRARGDRRIGSYTPAARIGI